MKKYCILILIFFCLSCSFCEAKILQSKTEVNFHKSDYINLDWWKKFSDGHLLNYIILALDNNYDLKNATLKTQEYNRFVRSEFGKELPQVAIGAQAAWLRTPGIDIGDVNFDNNSSGVYNIPLFVSYEADLFLKKHDKTKRMKKNYEISCYDEKAAYISLIASVATVYFNLVQIDELLKIQERILCLYEKNCYLESRKVLAGLSPKSEYNKSYKNNIQALKEYNDLKNEQSSLLNQLAVLIGKTYDENCTLERIQFSELKFNGNIPNVLESSVVFSRPDILKAEAELEKAKIDVRIARKELLPTIPLFGSIGFGSSEFSQIFNENSLYVFLGGALMQTLFAGGTKWNNLKIKKIQYEEMLNNYRQTDLLALQEVNNALFGVKTMSLNSENLAKSYQSESENFVYTDLKYKQGLISLQNKNEEEIKLLLNRKSWVKAKNMEFIAYLSLYKAAGAKI